MKTGARMSLSLAILVMLSACGEPAPTSDSPPTTTTTPLAEPEEPGMEIISVTACRQADPWTMVETAFQGTVTVIEPSADGIEGDTLQLVSFEVGAWYTADFGTTFSMWAPNFDGAVGEQWLIGGALYYSLDQQSGEVFPCVATPATERARGEWEQRFGPPVPAGSGVPEGDPDPALIAQIEEQQAKWHAAGIDDYTAVISVYTRVPGTEPCGGSSSIRVTVEDGVPTEAIDVMHFCTLDDPLRMLLIDDLFDLALANAGAITDPIDFDPELGYIRSFYASDRSVETGAYVEVLQPQVIDAVVGTQQAMDAAAAAIATWQTAGIHDYTYLLDVICFCTISGRFQVTVEDGVATEVTSESGPVDLSSPDRFMEYNVDGLFALVSDWGGGESPDEMLVSFDPLLGYPVEVRIDSIRQAVDDELSFFVSDFQPSA